MGRRLAQAVMTSGLGQAAIFVRNTSIRHL